MRLLLDSHFLIWMSEGETDQVPEKFLTAIIDPENSVFMSSASFWELKVKHATGKLKLSRPIEDLPNLLELGGLEHLPVTHPHALATLEQQPATKDPFDRLLLAQCQVEAMKLVTVDRALVRHPLSLKVR